MTEPTDLARVPGVIPYVDHHTGPRRLLTIDIPHLGHTVRAYAPIASVDGRQYIVSWGAVTFEIPADRNVHVSVHLQTNSGRDYTITPFASTVLPPHPAPIRLQTQFAPSQGPQGALVPVG
ncbi:hypothetical protein SAMN05421837_104697 [Amycolatopsis pretoriensis]|uniref:Uncharacterized protein n=1 Tax=Amycolatopsis pretoriensis TaxID=218821 RepID=A0A1H5QTH6_9PSEU|nr:hypothetical protein [Amycolatopsis pretoriensis]SEF29442.1 hypothetical protein SAMN05421837_104697 [Amycolatopsis pretoriensis]